MIDQRYRDVFTIRAINTQFKNFKIIFSLNLEFKPRIQRTVVATPATLLYVQTPAKFILF